MTARAFVWSVVCVLAAAVGLFSASVAHAWDQSDTVVSASGTSPPGSQYAPTWHARAVLVCRSITHDGAGTVSWEYADFGESGAWVCAPWTGSEADPATYPCPTLMGEWVFNPATETWDQAGPNAQACGWQTRIVPEVEPPASAASGAASDPLTQGTFEAWAQAAFVAALFMVGMVGLSHGKGSA